MENYLNDFDVNQILDFLGKFGTGIVIGILIVGLIALLVSIALYVISSLGYQKVAKYAGIEHSWFAWIPILRYYLIGEIGFEKLTDSKEEYMKWIMIGCALVPMAVATLSSIAGLVLYVLSIICYINIFKRIKPNDVVLYTILSAIGLSGIILNFISYDKNTKVELKELTKEEKKEETTSVKEDKIFCSACGTKMNKTASFCPNCGKEVKIK